ncbi:hypothetical protein QBC34DRAFT_438491 [Podospora aff. communis PSN243]|uniref:Microtubule associated protein n=1 Tax=Podospora aff. communis PSN243 TaxID=3040156 RepID=A0AAV9GLL0_9PEZI|nr:hypothetical protein QBC34DRAFT_438491 [Podospora aff. communis PSN243]
MAATPSRPPANAFVRGMRKVYNPIGFTKGYNFTLFFIFGGAMLGFTLARFQYLSYSGIFCGDDAQNFDCYHYDKFTVQKAGIILHLAAVLPAGFLACFQFVPAIRHKAIIVHRINGYIILLLSLVSTAGAFMVARHSFGGGLDVQVVVGVLAIMFIGSLAISYYNVKRLQLEQHRAWMLRAWFYAGCIITSRIAWIAIASITSNQGYYYFISCEQLASRFLLGSQASTIASFPQCEAYFQGRNATLLVPIEASMTDDGPLGPQAALNTGFGGAIWLALFIHAIGVEFYLQLTPAESERLRNVSYQRQVEAGMKHPGRAGLTADRIGDSAVWVPEEEK